MMARKAAAAVLACCLTLSSSAVPFGGVSAAEEALTAISVDTTAADGNGAFTATVRLVLHPQGLL